MMNCDSCRHYFLNGEHTHGCDLDLIHDGVKCGYHSLHTETIAITVESVDYIPLQDMEIKTPLQLLLEQKLYKRFKHPRNRCKRIPIQRQAVLPHGLDTMPIQEFCEHTKKRIEKFFGVPMSGIYPKVFSKRKRIYDFVIVWGMSYKSARYFVNFCERN